MPPRLLAIVEVAKQDRVQCQAPGCGHGVFKRIHVVQVGDTFSVLGSDCFARLHGGLSSALARYGSGDSRKLTEAERRLLIDNTRRFKEMLEAEQREKPATLPPVARGPQPVSRPRRLPLADWLKQLSPAQRAEYEALRMKLRADLRAKGINPDLPGWTVDAEARGQLEANQRNRPE